MKKKISCTFLSLVMVFLLIPNTVRAVSGSCGSTATWDFDQSSGTLTISGSGEISDYDYSLDLTSPWSNYLGQIKNVIIREGITRIGSGAFGGETTMHTCPNLSSISLPSTLKSIGVYAFAGSAIESISLPTSLEQLDAYAFANTNLTSVCIPQNVQSLGLYPPTGNVEDPFSGCPLETITVADGNKYFTVEDNVLYDKEQTEIICYPRKNNLANYRIPDTIDQILYISDFCDISNLESITIPASVTLTAYAGMTPPDGMMDSGEIVTLYFEGTVPEITADWIFYRDGYLLGIEAKKATLTQPVIKSLYPANKSSDFDYEDYDVSMFQITFDRQILNISEDEYIADVNLTSSAAFTIYRAADDTLVYKPSQYSTYDFGIAYTPEKSVLSVRPTNLRVLLEPSTEYYIIMGAGFVNFVDGTTNPTVQKGEWTFTTSGEPEQTGKLSFSVSRSALTVVARNTATPNVTLKPTEASVSWKSSNTNIAQVNRYGVVTGVSVGSATITGTATYGEQIKTVSYTVQVTPNLSVAFTSKTVNLNTDDTERIGYTVRPASQVIQVTSSNPSVVKVISTSSNNGSGIVSVRAVSSGSATLTLTAQSSGATVTDTCTVVVENDDQEVAQRFVNEALKYVGMNEYQFENSTGYNVPSSWCAAFIGVCAKLSGTQSIIPYNEGAGTICKEILNAGGSEFCFNASDKTGSFSNATIVRQETFEPHIGDIVALRLKGASGISHCGIVYAVNDKNVYIVHGNWNGSVAKTAFTHYSYKYTSPTYGPREMIIIGYARPNWSAASGIISGKTSDGYHCPVDVQISYNGEVLDSGTNQFVASFGTMSVNGTGDSRNISLELNDYYSDAETWINGTGTGSMTFTTISKDEDGTSGTRTFTNVPITPDTLIRVIRSNSAVGAVALEIFSNSGDVFKEVWYADSDTLNVSSPDEELTAWYLYGDTEEEIDNGTHGNNGSVTSSGDSDGDPSYTPIIDVSSGGTVSVNPRTPSEGDEVTLTVTPDNGYDVDEVIVTDRNGREISVTANLDGTYSFKQPNGRITIKVTFVQEGTDTFFTDVPETFWAYGEIKWASDNGYVNGVTATTFSPNATITRQQVWMILARLSGAAPASMAEARTWAMETGISDGTTPGNAVTRQQFAAMLYRYAISINPETATYKENISNYPDAEDVSSYALQSMNWAVGCGIITGTTAGTLNPNGASTRAQTVVMLYRFYRGMD